METDMKTNGHNGMWKSPGTYGAILASVLALIGVLSLVYMPRVEVNSSLVTRTEFGAYCEAVAVERAGIIAKLERIGEDTAYIKGKLEPKDK